MKSTYPMQRKRFVCAIVGLALVAGTVLCGTAFAAQRPSRTASSETNWSVDLDCSACHAVEAAVLGQADEEDAASSDSGAAPTSIAATQEDTTAALPGAPAADEASTAENDAPDAEGTTGLEGYAAEHVANFGLTCISCHDDVDKLAEVHKSAGAGKTATRLKKTDVSSEVCLSCHDLEVLAEATAKSTVLTDDNGTVINPHDIPEGSEHGTLGCTDCHKAHDQEKTLAQSAKTACTSCHHAGVFECNTCH